jgi:hypothetical protein
MRGGAPCGNETFWGEWIHSWKTRQCTPKKLQEMPDRIEAAFMSTQYFLDQLTVPCLEFGPIGSHYECQVASLLCDWDFSVPVAL